ncbi:MAG: alpha/beta hydrolase [Ewingella americana]|jgi:haloacetate dehalogenase|uniref:alpha/beta fold hydrolase n=1 Tax=Ewingella americana TaxID=41202 RepID=UPI000C2FD756|nr:alpha/beta hydrolase [Ewingella americana]MCI1677021.1 alpha/beta hydrolase [Ewingella americana]MCI1853389.1 alpha/beta hydrolase [Ewingella americana]MCI1860370.1 alpha/beta hydrolase [Ewingella americana]MCI2141389.1 alpha/beta hydrolase [Ewingella americana]MCI2162904.1 alpha/beta hydrolase [Ewingella americana]
MLEHFTQGRIAVNGTDIAYRIAGQGEPLLLLHGHPQTQAIWHKVAPYLTSQYTVVLADLRGYGDSGKPEPDAEHYLYSKREMAQDQYELMLALGFKQFSVIAHDRGARVAHRLALDHPQAIKRMVLMDIAPTLSMYQQTNEEFARAYWHWFFLIRPAPLPEALISHDADLYLRSVMGSRSAGMQPFTDEAYADYLRCLQLDGTARGICEDYRASASIDLQHDQIDLEASRKVQCPLLILWGEQGTVGKCFKPLEEWAKVAEQVTGEALPCGHYIAEEQPELLLEKVLPFLRQ